MGQFTATPGAEGRAGPSRLKSPLSRSYGRILPSSFTTIISIASVFSTYPPVSVWGTGGTTTRSRSFSRQHRITQPAPPKVRAHHVSGITECGFTYIPPYTLSLRQPTREDELPSCVPPQLAYYTLGSQTQPPATPKGNRQSRMLSIARLSTGVVSPVREYQPVVHRLRLSASP